MLEYKKLWVPTSRRRCEKWEFDGVKRKDIA